MTELAQEEEEEAIAACSFCMKSNTQVRKLIAGPGVYICDECVDLCVQIITDEFDLRGDPSEPASERAGQGAGEQASERAGEQEKVPRAPLWDRLDSVEQALDLLPKIAAAGAQVEANLMALVRRARTLGATWAKIGEALGMTRQSAWERFSGEE